MKLLTTGNPKLAKGTKKGYLTAGLHFAPHKLSGYNVCPMASKGCAAACLNTAGRGRFQRTQDARVRKTKRFFEDRKQFMLDLEKDISSFVTKASNKKLKPVVRLNVLSDIKWENISFVGKDGKKYKNMMERFPKVQFMDYTKHHIRKNLPKNYHLTYSLAEDNDARAKKAIKNGLNVAVVFRTSDFPKKFWSLPVIDGDETDLRFKDGKKKIVGLKAKGKAKKDQTGFVREV